MYKVAVVGHSQVPLHISSPRGINIRVFRRPGALLRHIDESPLKEVFDYEPDLAILFLGGNDITVGKEDARNTIAKIRDLLLRLKTVCERVVFVLIERRNYAERNPYGMTTEIYETHRRFINQNLRRFLRANNIRTINLAAPWFAAHRRPDGIHLSHEAKEEFKRKVLICVEKTRISIGK